ncbi:hypothetical protein, partial [Staphylococcus aureus]
MIKTNMVLNNICLLYTSDAADDSLRVDLGGRRIIKKECCLLYTSDAADDSLRVDLGGRRIIKKGGGVCGLC